MSNEAYKMALDFVKAKALLHNGWDGPEEFHAGWDAVYHTQEDEDIITEILRIHEDFRYGNDAPENLSKMDYAELAIAIYRKYAEITDGMGEVIEDRYAAAKNAAME